MRSPSVTLRTLCNICPRADCILLSVCLSLSFSCFFCTWCTIHIINMCWVYKQNGYRTDGSHADIHIHLHDGTATEWPRYAIISTVNWFTVVCLSEAVWHLPGTVASAPRRDLHAVAKLVLRRVAGWPRCAAHAQYARTAVGEVAHWRGQLQGQSLIFVQSIDRSYCYRLQRFANTFV